VDIVRGIRTKFLILLEGAILVLLTGLSPITFSGELHTAIWIHAETIQDISEPYPGNTLISGRNVIEVNSSTGDIVWLYTGKDAPGLVSQSNPLDADRLKNGNTLITYFSGTLTERPDYPPGMAGYPSVVVEVNSEGEILWNFSRGLDFAHDADRLPSGNTIIVDSSPNIHNERILEVDSDRNVVWEYKTGFGSFPNDVDVLSSSNILISLRDWNMLIEVNRQGEIVWIFNNTDVLRKQHNPDLLWNNRLIVADSFHDRILEIDRKTGDVSWDFRGINVGGLSFPRDADKLPSGGLLITDSRANRVIEISQTGDLIWQYEVEMPAETMLYDADRLNIPPVIEIASPIAGTYPTEQIEIILTTPDLDVSKMWYRIYDVERGDWLDPTNITWTEPVFRSLKPSTYAIWAWANDTGDWSQGDPHWSMTSEPVMIQLVISQASVPGFALLITWGTLIVMTINRKSRKNRIMSSPM